MAHLDTTQAQRANRTFVKSAMKVAMLDAERELALARAWREHGDQAALHELTGAYMRLVISVAGRYRNYGLPVGDLIQEGNVGLMQAAARFEPERALRFSTYATWWIRSAIQDYVLRNWSIVRTGTTAAQKTLFFNLRRLAARIDDGGRGHLTEEGRRFVAKELKVGHDDVLAMEGRMNGADRSLNAPMGDDSGLDWQDALADERPNPEAAVMEQFDTRAQKIWIAKAMDTLTEREQSVIRARLLEEQADTLESLGTKLKVSKERVRQIEAQALSKLKAALIKQVGDPRERGLI
jgi:RNA polymerase sigma-32 factor